MYFLSLSLQAVIMDLVRETPIITGVEGKNICNKTFCAPNPCMNGGSCSLNDQSQGGYQCSCPDGYTGKNCDQDVEECAESECQNYSPLI